MVDSHLLPLLRCVHCGSTGLRPSADRLVCDACTRAYEIRPPGIPRLITDETRRRNAVHEQEWDSMPHADYDQICRDNRAVWEAIDSLATKYCNGFTLEACCGSGRFLDVLRRVTRVTHVVGVDISIAMLRVAWDKGHRWLLQGSADDLPVPSGSMDTVASSGSGLSFLDREKTYAEVARVLKPHGHFVFDLLNYWPSVLDCAWERYLSHGRLPGREILSEYKLADNMRDAKHEVQMLRRAGLQMVEMTSVRYVPFLRRRQAKLGYWSGFWGSRIGYDTVFVCQRPGRSSLV
jgi:ubiquinone/menaquinone biosynthesis C-methylase UbiE